MSGGTDAAAGEYHTPWAEHDGPHVGCTGALPLKAAKYAPCSVVTIEAVPPPGEFSSAKRLTVSLRPSVLSLIHISEPTRPY